MKKPRRSWTRASNASWPRIWRLPKILLFPPPELAEQGVYCEGCHTIEAAMAAAERGSDAAEIERDRSLEGHRFWRRHAAG